MKFNQINNALFKWNYIFRFHVTPLIMAIEKENPEIVALLMNRKEIETNCKFIFNIILLIQF